MKSLNSRMDMDPGMDEIGSIYDVVAPVLSTEAIYMTISSAEMAGCPSTSGNSSTTYLLNSADDIDSVGDLGGGIRSSCVELDFLFAEDVIAIDFPGVAQSRLFG